MTSFKFPPPPPPPPKASSNDSQQPYATQRGGHTRGGGDRGRGRGGWPGQGAGFHSSSGNARGGHGANNGRGDGRGRGGSRGGHQSNRGGGYQRGVSTTSYGQPQHHHFLPQTNAPPIATPSMSYVNPLFKNQEQYGGERQPQPQVNTNALVSAMSFIATPAGQQSMAAFANHMANVGSAAPQYSQSPLPRHAHPASRYSPPQQAGQKRKLNDRNSNAQPQMQRNPPQQGSKPPRAKAAVPPPVPNFGFSLPTPPVVRPPTTKAKSTKDQKKRKMNLGLTHHLLPEESSDEEDVDEEVAYAAKLKGGGFAFEHKGEQITIRTAAEVAAWIKDRRRNFPTQKRIVEKAEEAASKRTSELNFLRKLKGKPTRSQDVPRQDKPIRSRNRDMEDKRKQDDKRRHEELAALRKRLHESMMKKQAAPTTVDLGLGYDSETESDGESSVLSESSVVSISDEESESESESDESDEAPEPTSSKVNPPPIKVPRPAVVPTPSQPTTSESRVCPDWRRNGRCKYSSKCRLEHPPKEVKHVSLYERLVEQEMAKADQLALDAIKYLGQQGFLN